MSPDARPQIVVLSSIEWDAAWQRHQIFASQFAAAGRDVFFVENSGFRNPRVSDLPRVARRFAGAAKRVGVPLEARKSSGVSIVTPWVLPPTAPAFRLLNEAVFVPRLVEQLRRRGLRSHPVVIAYFPTATTLAAIRALEPRAVIYDCASNFRGHPMAPADLPQLEAELLRLSDLVVCDSDYLYKQKSAEHPRVVQIHQGVSETFFDAKPQDAAYERACYYGTWVPDLDAGLLNALCEAGLDVTVSGFVRGEPPAFAPGVKRLPPTALDTLVARLENFDVFLLPHKITQFHLGVVPAKIYECLAMGRPVIATPLPSLAPFKDLIYVGETAADWARIARELPRTETPDLRRRRIETARAHTHAAEFARLRAEVDAACACAAPKTGLEAPIWARGYGQRFLRGFTWIGFLYGVARVSTLLTQVLAGRMLGPKPYGEANLVLAVAAFLQVLPIMGFPLALSKFLADEPSEERRKAIVSTTLTAFWVWGALWLALLWGLKHWLAARAGVPAEVFTTALIYSFCTALYVVVSSPLLGLQRFEERGLAEAVYGLSAPLFLLAFVLHGDRSFHALIVSLCLSLAAAAAYAVWSVRGYLKPAFEGAAFRRVGGYAAVGAVNLATTACIVSPARLILNSRFTAHEVGVFSAYFTSTAQISLALLYVLSSVLVPISSRPEGQAEAWRLMRKGWPGLLVAAWLAFCAAAVAGLALFGRQYPLVIPWVALFSGASALILLHGVAGALLSARDFEGLQVAAFGSALAAAANVGFAMVLIPRFGIPGAAAALVGAYVLGYGYYLTQAPK